MQRTFVMKTIGGGFIGMEEDVSISRNERTRRWTVYFRSDDPDGRGTLRHSMGAPSEFVEAFRMRGVGLEEFCESLEQEFGEDWPELRQLSEQLRDALGKEQIRRS